MDFCLKEVGGVDKDVLVLRLGIGLAEEVSHPLVHPESPLVTNEHHVVGGSEECVGTEAPIGIAEIQNAAIINVPKRHIYTRGLRYQLFQPGTKSGTE